MNFADLKIRVNRAISKLYAFDSNLFDYRLSEWTIAHRLAVYLEQEIPGWNVDCEYNKQGENGDDKMNAATGRPSGKTRPDIILHHRGWSTPDHNLLIVELKIEDLADDAKIQEFTRPPDAKRKFQYQYGLALAFLPTLQPRWYSDGKLQ